MRYQDLGTRPLAGQIAACRIGLGIGQWYEQRAPGRLLGRWGRLGGADHLAAPIVLLVVVPVELS